MPIDKALSNVDCVANHPRHRKNSDASPNVAPTQNMALFHTSQRKLIIVVREKLSQSDAFFETPNLAR